MTGADGVNMAHSCLAFVHSEAYTCSHVLSGYRTCMMMTLSWIPNVSRTSPFISLESEPRIQPLPGAMSPLLDKTTSLTFTSAPQSALRQVGSVRVHQTGCIKRWDVTDQQRVSVVRQPGSWYMSSPSTVPRERNLAWTFNKPVAVCPDLSIALIHLHPSRIKALLSRNNGLKRREPNCFCNTQDGLRKRSFPFG